MDDPLPFRLCRGGRSGWSSLEPGTYSPGCHGNTVECGLRDGNSGDPGHYDQPLPVLLASRAGNRREIGRAHVCTPVTNAHLVCRLLLENKNNNDIYEDITS